MAKAKKMSAGATEIMLLLKANKIKFEQEYRFHPVRKFRMDFALVDRKVCIEYEGISGRSRHTSITGYSRDCEKYNLATVMGWKILRYTMLNKQNVIEDLKEILK
jgi:very-short-patch-repair endonuclease